MTEQLLNEIATTLRGFQFQYTSEADIQLAVSSILEPFRPKREFVLSKKDRVDFLVRKEGVSIGIEIKVQGSTNEVLSQCLRYADHPDICGMVLVTLCARHRSIPKTLRGKPMEIVYIGGFG